MRIFCIIAILMLVSSTYAAQCPFASELQHEPGAKWSVAPPYQALGWRIHSSRPADLSALREMPAEANLYVQLYPNNPVDNRSSCLYTLKGHEQWMVHLSNPKIFDPEKVPTPPFKENNQHPKGYRCDTLAGTADACYWSLED